MRYFASAPEPEGNVPFTIGSDGRRIDALPPVPGPQWMLGWVFWLLGMVLLLCSSHSDAFSLILFIAILLKGHAAYYLWLSTMRQSASPESFRPLISPKNFAEQSQHHTKLALEALRSHMQANPQALGRVREDSELRLRRFADGAAHCPRFGELAIDEGGGMCIVL
mmetsp:Transcript_85219/g.264803  ORF Transcript_85219/g.264803 Transcript_85219/m.264803 type:complete len:166 (-) Transcript_85219:112-609(-)